jgi:hypothetical protein
MTCCININKITYDITEAEIIGIFCAIFDCFGENLGDPIFNIEVHHTTSPTLLPKFKSKTWTLFDKLYTIKNFCSSLKIKDNDKSEITPTFHNKNTVKELEQTYYLDTKDIANFMTGYSNLFNYLRVESNYIIDKNDTKHQCIPNNELIYHCKLDTTNKKDRKFKIDEYHYTWELPMYQDNYIRQVTANLVNVFLRDCDDYHRQILLTSNHYLRIHVYQDKAESNRYCYGYVKPIDSSIFDDYINIPRSIPQNKLLCKIILSATEYYFEIPIIEWINKYVYHVIPVSS